MNFLSTSSLLPNWGKVRYKADLLPWGREILRSIREQNSHWAGRLTIPDPREPSDWTHHFFCSDDGEKLIFDPVQPHAHACSKCGKIYRGEPQDGAWRALMHNLVALQVERDALLIRLGTEKEVREAKEDLKKWLLHYIAHYASYEVHGKNSGKGRVLPQNLDEAIWLITLLRSFRWSGLESEFEEQSLAGLKKMASMGVELLKPQIGAIHNIPCWILASLAECALVLEDAALLEWCRTSEYGIENQIAKGFTDEGIWWEVSLGYHYYAIAGILAYVEAVGISDLSDKALKKLVLSLNHPVALAYENGRLPAYGDCWPQIHLLGGAAAAETAFGLLPGCHIDLPGYYTREQTRPIQPYSFCPDPSTSLITLESRASVAALLYGPEEVGKTVSAKASLLLSDTGVGVLRNEKVRLGIRFGKDCGWHDHNDKLCVDVETAKGWQSLDLGTSGYGSSFTDWMRSPAAHSMVVIDGLRQKAHEGKLLEYSTNRISAESREALPGALLQRTLSLTPEGWSDDYEVSLAASGRVDWIFHGDGLFAAEENEGEPATLDEEGGYRWFQEVRELFPTNKLKGAWKTADTGVGLEMEIPEGFRVWLARAEGNPNGRPMGVVLVRGNATRVNFGARFSVL